ncbi:MAG: hypothetical protein HWD60_06630 [Defluviicoccus sp.]|nr:MAG: hypothetical protein HWD60_06630 [Defluviicoccus sp.]
MPRSSRSFRLLPIVVATSALVLTTKLFDVANGFDRILTSGLAVGAAHAETSKPEHAPAKAEHGTTHAPDATTSIEHERVRNQAKDGLADATPVRRQIALDQPPLPSPQELQILQSLAQRREALDQRAQELDRRTVLLQAAEARLDDQLAELKDMQTTLTKLIRTHDEQQEEKLRSLVKIYENMKPRDASRIFEELDMDILLPVVERMKERKLAPVLASMNPVRAKTITEELARLRQLASHTGPTHSG